MSDPRDPFDELPPELDPRRGQEPPPRRARGVGDSAPRARGGSGGRRDGRGDAGAGDGRAPAPGDPPWPPPPGPYSSRYGEPAGYGRPGPQASDHDQPRASGGGRPPRGPVGPDGRRTGSGGPSGPRSGGPGAGRGRRRQAALIAKVVVAMISVLILCVSGVMWGMWKKFNVDVARINALPSDSTVPPAAGNPGQNILIIGSDNRAGLTKQQLEEVGTDQNAGVNTDTIMLLHLPADGSRATVISIPRDSYVDIPGYKRNKVNAAYADGACLDAQGNPLDCGKPLTDDQRSRGAQVLIRTVSQLTGVHIDHYVEVTLYGFYTISNAIGGVQVCLARRWYDPQYEHGIDVPAGEVTLKGKLALAFVRERHGLPGGDLDRIKRQQAFISALIRKVLTAGTLLNPFKLNSLVETVAKSLTFDQSFDPTKLVDSVRNIAAGNVTFTTIPTHGNQWEDGKSVLGVNPAEVQAFVKQAIAGGASAKTTPPSPPTSPHSTTPSSPPTVAPGDVHVKVLNGAGVAGLAGRTQTQLESHGFNVTGVGNASTSTYPASEIHYPAGQQGAAQTLAAYIPGATLVADGSGSTLTLILGKSFSGVSSMSGSGSSSGGGGPGGGSGTSAGGGASAASSPSSSGGSTAESRTAADTGCVN